MEIETQSYNNYIASLFAPQDTVLTDAIARMADEHIPMINVSATEGKLLQILALSVGAKNILEIGTLGGYSGIHLARALPEGGKLVTLEIDEHHAAVARHNFDLAGVDAKVEVKVGPASDSLAELAAANGPLFDVVFIDANKDGYVDYLRQSLPLLRDGGLLLADNTLPDAILTGDDSGTKRYNAAVSAHNELETIIVPILRGRGIDGLTVSFKRTASTGN